MRGQHISFSQLGTFNTCKKQYYWKYIEGLLPRKFNDSLQLGTIVHEGLQRLYETGDPDMAMALIQVSLNEIDKTMFKEQDFEDYESMKIIAKAMVIGAYHIFYIDDFEKYEIIELERKHSIPIRNPKSNYATGYNFEFIADGVLKERATGRYWLLEYKTASRLGDGYFNRLKIDYQCTANIYYLEKIYGIKFSGVIYRIFKKPSIRLKKTETPDEFLTRLSEVFEEQSEEYFLELKLFRDRKEIENFANIAYLCTRELKAVIKSKFYFQNTKICNLINCPYTPLCNNEVGVKETLFEERSEIYG
jgi:hypothetical protein